VQASLDRGFGRCSVLRSHKSAIKKHANRIMDRIIAPAKGLEAKGRALRAKERALDRDGIAAVGQSIRPGELLVQKICLCVVIES